jgi:hypothetical protein
MMHWQSRNAVDVAKKNELAKQVIARLEASKMAKAAEEVNQLHLKHVA